MTAGTPSTPPDEDLVELTRRLVGLGSDAGLPLRALGGLGVFLRSEEADPALHRTYLDVDLAAPRRARHDLEAVMTGASLLPEPEFNLLQGSRRQIWWTPDGSTHVDVFLGEFAMCHRVDLEPGLTVEHPALPAADLLLTKLQVIELNLKDAQDLAALLSTHRLGDSREPGVIDVDRVQHVLASDWGFYTTVSDNLERIPDALAGLAPAVASSVADACVALRDAIDEAPKTRAFKLRARVGRRRRWYDVPEESL